MLEGNLPPSRAERKAEAILSAARSHFYRDGFAATSVDSISRGAGIGKATIYKHFGSKQGLFAAVVAQENRHGLEAIQAVVLGQGPLDKRLTKAAGILLDLLTAPDFIASYRMVMSEATRFPELATLYYGGAVELLGTLSKCFEALSEAKQLVVENPLLAAEQFVGLIRGDLQLRALLGVPAPDQNERRAIITGGVSVFMGYYAGGGASI